MKDPSQNKNIPSINNDDVILNGHSFDDDNPFAEYMWMENEEEFNRQVTTAVDVSILSDATETCSSNCNLLSVRM